MMRLFHSLSAEWRSWIDYVPSKSSATGNFSNGPTTLSSNELTHHGAELNIITFLLRYDYHFKFTEKKKRCGIVSWIIREGLDSFVKSSNDLSSLLCFAINIKPLHGSMGRLSCRFQEMG